MPRLVSPEQFATGYKVRVKVGSEVVTMTKPYELVARYLDGTCLVRDLEEPQPHSPKVLRRRPTLGRRVMAQRSR